MATGWTSKPPVGFACRERERSRRCRRRRGRDGREIVELRRGGRKRMTRACQTRVRTAYERHRLTLALSSLRALSTRCSGRQASRKNELSQTAVVRAFDLLPSDLQVDIRNVMRHPRATLPDQSEEGLLAEEDEDDVCRDRGDRGDANDVLSDSDAVQMDETFVASLQVGKGALDKRAMKQREDALRAMEWNPVSSAYEEGVLAYPVHVGQDQRGDEPNCLLPQI
ncbi:hypothetical protein PC120_g25510 [Phytophthora cactorum]|nr:hypothetical protein PC120_g25510 [Phytophthora cactorum]